MLLLGSRGRQGSTLLSLERMFVGDRSEGSMSGYYIPFSQWFFSGFPVLWISQRLFHANLMGGAEVNCMKVLEKDAADHKYL